MDEMIKQRARLDGIITLVDGELASQGPEQYANANSGPVYKEVCPLWDSLARHAPVGGTVDPVWCV
jgi:hypothetical protein